MSSRVKRLIAWCMTHLGRSRAEPCLASGFRGVIEPLGPLDRPGC
jgi:hypothetical protein